jgi:methyl-accepting chemotaxis protein
VTVQELEPGSAADAADERSRTASIAAGARRLLPSMQPDTDRVIAVIERLAAGDVTARCRDAGSTGRLATAVDALADRINELVAGIAGSVDLLNSGGEDLFMASAQLSSATEVAAEQVGLVTTASRQIAGEVACVADGVQTLSANTQELSRSIHSSASASESAQTASVQAVDSVALGERLQSSAEQIQSVVGAIAKIASQTKLLALNAAIESARAGDAGVGFGVVAQEVKQLAQQTQEATDDITQRISQIVTDSTSASRAFREIREILDAVAASHEMQTSTAAAIDEQNEAASRIAEFATSAGQGATEITNAIETTNVAVQTAAAASSGVQDQAMRLLGTASELARLRDAWGMTTTADDGAF